MSKNKIRTKKDLSDRFQLQTHTKTRGCCFPSMTEWLSEWYHLGIIRGPSGDLCFFLPYRVSLLAYCLSYCEWGLWRLCCTGLLHTQRRRKSCILQPSMCFRLLQLVCITCAEPRGVILHHD
jgi:hypothetical protein